MCGRGCRQVVQGRVVQVGTVGRLCREGLCKGLNIGFVLSKRRLAALCWLNSLLSELSLGVSHVTWAAQGLPQRPGLVSHLRQGAPSRQHSSLHTAGMRCYWCLCDPDAGILHSSISHSLQGLPDEQGGTSIAPLTPPVPPQRNATCTTAPRPACKDPSTPAQHRSPLTPTHQPSRCTAPSSWLCQVLSVTKVRAAFPHTAAPAASSLACRMAACSHTPATASSGPAGLTVCHSVSWTSGVSPWRIFTSASGRLRRQLKTSRNHSTPSIG